MNSPDIEGTITQDELLAELELMAKRRDADKLRPHQCICGHSKQAHDSGFAFCWFCGCEKWRDRHD